MANYNYVCLIGNLTFDPELSYTPGAVAYCRLRMATNEVFFNKENEKVESVLFMDVTVWKKQAESCAKFLKKGSSVQVVGKLKLDEWLNEAGEKRKKMQVIARQVLFLGKSDMQKIDEQDEHRVSAEGAPEGTPPVEHDQPEEKKPIDEEDIPF